MNSEIIDRVKALESDVIALRTMLDGFISNLCNASRNIEQALYQCRDIIRKIEKQRGD